MFTSLSKSLKIVALVVLGLASTACTSTAQYGVADYSYHATGSYSSASTGSNIYSDFQ